MIFKDIATTTIGVLALAFLAAGILLNFIRYMHMFQLNSYHAGPQFKWLIANIKHVLVCRILSLSCLAVLFVYSETAAGCIAAALISAVILPFAKPKKAKKKLVFTPRVIRMCVTACIVYALTITAAIMISCYFLLAAVLVTEFIAVIANFINTPVEKSVNRYYINDAKRIIGELPNLTVIGITGSYGKTSTKYFLNTLLSAGFNVVMTPESYNTTMGVVKTVRSSLNATHEIFICEMGAKGVGEIKEICDIVKPKHSMITSIGPQHLESFKSLENIIKTKFEIADALIDGTLFLNYDNPNIRANKTDKHVIKYGISADYRSELDYFADEVGISGKGTTFRLTVPGGESCSFETRLIGEHNVQNIVGAIAIAHYLGVGLDKLKFAVKRLQSVPHRLELIDSGGRIIIDDAFNSNPSGAKAALDALAMIGGYKILITPGMIELGEKEYELNAEFGSYAADICDFAVLIGEKRAAPIKSGLLQNGFTEDKIKVAPSFTEGLSFAESLDSGGKKKVILLENDLPDNY